MSNRRILFFTVASLFVLVIVSRYAVQETASSGDPQEATGDLNHLSDQNSKAQSVAVVPQAEVVKPTATSLMQSSLTPDEQKKLELFRAVIKTGKDNDPRVDSELKSLTPALKNALKKEYEQLPPEHRNGRGFIAFLIGRSMTEPADVDFLAQIVQEEPCLSFKDCSARGPMYEEAEEHSTQVTLNYPQIVATRMLKQNLSKVPPELRGRINEVLAESRY